MCLTFGNLKSIFLYVYRESVELNTPIVFSLTRIKLENFQAVVKTPFTEVKHVLDNYHAAVPSSCGCLAEVG